MQAIVQYLAELVNSYLVGKSQWADCKLTCGGPFLLEPSVHQSHSLIPSNWSSTKRKWEIERKGQRWKGVMDDGNVRVSKLVNGCTTFVKFMKMTWKETDMERHKLYIQTHLAILTILPGCSRSCKIVRYYMMSHLMCCIICLSASQCCTINNIMQFPWNSTSSSGTGSIHQELHKHSVKKVKSEQQPFTCESIL